MIIYEFLYCDCVHESAYATLSLHRTREGAQKALDTHKADKLAKFEEGKKFMHQHWLDDNEISDEDRKYMLEDNANREFGMHEDWQIGEQELADDGVVTLSNSNEPLNAVVSPHWDNNGRLDGGWLYRDGILVGHIDPVGEPGEPGKSNIQTDNTESNNK